MMKKEKYEIFVNKIIYIFYILSYSWFLYMRTNCSQIVKKKIKNPSLDVASFCLVGC